MQRNLGSFLPKDACELDRSRQELSNESLSMSLPPNLLFEPDPYSNEYLVAKSVFDTADNESSEVCQEFDSYTD